MIFVRMSLEEKISKGKMVLGWFAPDDGRESINRAKS